MSDFFLVRNDGMLERFPPDVMEMMSPARCTWCGGIYDLGSVTVTARYTDCSMWKAPCCGRTVDDRGETGWKSIPDYHKVDKRALQR